MKQYDLYISSGVVNFNPLVIIILNFKYSMEVDNYACMLCCDRSPKLQITDHIQATKTKEQECSSLFVARIPLAEFFLKYKCLYKSKENHLL